MHIWFTPINLDRPPDQTLERLDWFVANTEWLNAFPDHQSSNLDFFASDHRPVRLKTNPPKPNQLPTQPKPFTFEHNWLLKEDYKDTIKTL